MRYDSRPGHLPRSGIFRTGPLADEKSVLVAIAATIIRAGIITLITKVRMLPHRHITTLTERTFRNLPARFQEKTGRIPE